MSFLDVIKKRGGQAARGIGSVVRAAVMDKPKEEPVAAPTPEPKDRIPKGFTLPDLDPDDPDYADRKQVHDALLSLDKHWTEAMPSIDYEGHYRKLAEEMKKAPEKREWNVLSKLAIALGTQNPDDIYSENLGLATMRRESESRQAQQRKEFEETMGLKKEALSGHIKQLMEQGKFRQALTELAAKEQLGITKARREHEFKIEEESQKGDIKKEVARIQAQAALERAERRLAYLRETSAKLRLSPSDKAQMDAEYRAAGARLADTKKQWAEGMISDEQVEVAEEEHRQEMKRIHDYFEDRELGERPPEAGPREGSPKPRGGMEPNPEDPWFKK